MISNSVHPDKYSAFLRGCARAMQDLRKLRGLSREALAEKSGTKLTGACLRLLSSNNGRPKGWGAKSLYKLLRALDGELHIEPKERAAQMNAMMIYGLTRRGRPTSELVDEPLRALDAAEEAALEARCFKDPRSGALIRDDTGDPIVANIREDVEEVQRAGRELINQGAVRVNAFY